MNTAELKKKWFALCARRGASKRQEEVFTELETRYNEPHRRYHNLDHIAQMLEGLETFEELAKNLEAIEFAIWFHDAIYETRAKDNEEKKRGAR